MKIYLILFVKIYYNIKIKGLFIDMLFVKNFYIYFFYLNLSFV